jgi:hypothetical protein
MTSPRACARSSSRNSVCSGCCICARSSSRSSYRRSRRFCFRAGTRSRFSNGSRLGCRSGVRPSPCSRTTNSRRTSPRSGDCTSKTTGAASRRACHHRPPAVLPFGFCLLTFDLTPHLLWISSNPNTKRARRPSGSGTTAEMVTAMVRGTKTQMPAPMQDSAPGAGSAYACGRAMDTPPRIAEPDLLAAGLRGGL